MSLSFSFKKNKGKLVYFELNIFFLIFEKEVREKKEVKLSFLFFLFFFNLKTLRHYINCSTNSKDDDDISFIVLIYHILLPFKKNKL